MFNTVQALVLREVRYKEADKILTLFTKSDGKITAKARGALRKGSKITAATQQLTYSEMTLFGNRGKWSVNEASVIESFDGLRNDIADFALGCYFAECLEALGVEDQPDEAMLQLGLNSLYALSRKMYPGGAYQGRVRAAADVPCGLYAGAWRLRGMRQGGAGKSAAEPVERRSMLPWLPDGGDGAGRPAGRRLACRNAVYCLRSGRSRYSPSP